MNGHLADNCLYAVVNKLVSYDMAVTATYAVDNQVRLELALGENCAFCFKGPFSLFHEYGPNTIVNAIMRKLEECL